MVWEKMELNEVLQGDGFYISYNHKPGGLVSMFAADNDSDETALVSDNDPEHHYRILNGDFREAYELIIDLGFDACLDLFEKFKDKRGSSWSTHLDDRKGV